MECLPGQRVDDPQHSTWSTKRSGQTGKEWEVNQANFQSSNQVNYSCKKTRETQTLDTQNNFTL